jgi:hypothetical protein
VGVLEVHFNMDTLKHYMLIGYMLIGMIGKNYDIRERE